MHKVTLRCTQIKAKIQNFLRSAAKNISAQLIGMTQFF
jgi:hypothetical protein|tara:strand:- start:39893 stop:40006 length:114 start_codon:yes stop_codon:yes gene_type:complete